MAIPPGEVAKWKDYGEGGCESKQNAMHQWDSVNRKLIGHGEVHGAEGTFCSHRNSAGGGEFCLHSIYINPKGNSLLSGLVSGNVQRSC